MVYFGAFFEVLALAYFLKGVFSMDIKFFSNTSSTCAVTDTAIIQGKLILANDPVNPNDATTKEYVDNLVSTSQTIVNNHINNQQLHLTSTQSALLSNITVTSSQINYLANVNNPIQPQLDSKVKLSGDTLTGNLTLVGDPSSSLHAATKQYADNRVTALAQIPTGFILLMESNPNGYSGFLQCNGAEISKTTYSNLYSVLGDNYSVSLQPGSGVPWKQQYFINSTQNGDITGWTTGTNLPDSLAWCQAVVTKNRVYLLGGVINGSWSSTVYYAPINSDGSLGSWSTGTSLPQTVAYSEAIVTKNRVYLLGGVINGSYLSTVYYAPINSDGSLGSWSVGPSLPQVIGISQAIVTKNRVYLLGGYNGNFLSTVYYAPINSDGSLGNWSEGPSLPQKIDDAQAIVTKNRVYLLGGNSPSSNLSTVYYAPINSDGSLGSWSEGPSISQPIRYSQAIVTKNRVYLLGGYNGSSYLSTVYYAPINSDGSLGSWSAGTSLPQAVVYSQAIVTKNRVYLLGGYNGSSYLSTVYYAPFSGGLNDYSPYYDGTIGPVSTLTDPVNNFQLPDLSNEKPYSTQTYYIKT
jgi:N-acetylneuraminic acid mutarotase